MRSVTLIHSPPRVVPGIQHVPYNDERHIREPIDLSADYGARHPPGTNHIRMRLR
jgi:hypothetical protein